jgi:WD40 repeat protein/serine/threonine protein kinase
MSTPSVQENLSLESLVAQVVDEFVERQKRGEQPDVEEYAARHPQAGVVLRKVLASLQLLALSASAGAAEPGVAPEDPVAGTLGDFRIVQELGRGGMGIVYEAEQMCRRVALKILPFAAALDPKQLQRFKNEAQAAAHLQHQHIVPVHYVGCERGVHFYAMQYVEGQTLATLIRELRHLAGLEKAVPASAAEAACALASELASGRWAPVKRRDGEVVQPCGREQATGPYLATSPPRQRTIPPAQDATPPAPALSTECSIRSSGFFRTVAHLGVQAAEAMEHAHQMGVIHRDIKPANLLLDAAGSLWVTDFGLAKLRSEAGLTMTGDLVGTLRYMSPEQALAKCVAVDTRTDVYSLGVTLYELLTLEPAYNGRNREDVLRQIAFEEPRPPSRLNKSVAAELETIVLKAMAKNPEERYATAQELADDLRRYLEDKPIRAKRPTLRQRAVKWARRHKTAVRAALVVLVLAMVALAVSTALIWRAKEDLGKALERERQTSYYQRIALAEREWSANSLGRVEELLEACPPDLRGWEWHYLKRLRLQSIPEMRHDAAVFSAVFSPDDRWIASGDLNGRVTVWDATTGRVQHGYPAHERHVRCVAFSPDGQLLATASWDRTVKVWNFDPERAGGGNTPLLMLTGHQAPVSSVAFSPDSQRLASAGDDKTVRVWDAATGHQILTLPGPPTGHEIVIPAGPTTSLQYVAYSPDGQHLASASGATVIIWDATTGSEKQPLRGHKIPVVSMSFSHDGKQLASAASDADTRADGEVKVWDTQTGQEVLSLRGHVAWVLCVAFSPDGRRLATAGLEGNIKLWDLATGQEVLTLRGHRGGIRSLAFSRDGNRLVSACQDRTVRVWDATPLQGEARQEVATFRGHNGGVRSVAFSPDGRQLASAGDDAKVFVWDFMGGLAGVAKSLIVPLSGGTAIYSNVTFSSDGQLLASGGGGGQLRGGLKVWEATTWKELYMDPTMGCPVAFSPDAQHLAAVRTEFGIAILGATTGREIHTLRGHTWAISAMAFSPSPGPVRFASAGSEGTVRIWDLATGGGNILQELHHTDVVHTVAFSPGGKYLASGDGIGP